MASPEAIDGVTEATSEEIYGATEASDSTFPAVDTDKELNPGTDKNSEVDPTSHDVATSLETKVYLVLFIYLFYFVEWSCA